MSEHIHNPQLVTPYDEITTDDVVGQLLNGADYGGETRFVVAQPSGWMIYDTAGKWTLGHPGNPTITKTIHDTLDEAIYDLVSQHNLRAKRLGSSAVDIVHYWNDNPAAERADNPDFVASVRASAERYNHRTIIDERPID